MKRALIILVICISVISCGDSDSEAEGIIEKEKMIELLTDVQMLESTAVFVRNKNADFEIGEGYLWLFDQYGVTEEEFKKSVEFYASDPKTYEEMYDRIIINISEKQAELTRISGDKEVKNVQKRALLNAESE